MPDQPNIAQVVAQMFAGAAAFVPAQYQVFTHKQEDGTQLFSIVIVKPGGDISHTMFDQGGFQKFAHTLMELLGEKPTGLVIADGSSIFGAPRPNGQS